MSKKSSNVLEKYIDKIILGIVGLVGLYLLYAYVLTSPNTIEFNREKYGPGDLDKAIREQARLIEEKLGQKEVTDEKVYQPKLADFKSIVASPIKNIDDGTYAQLPAANSAGQDKALYDIPKVCDINNVKVRTATAVAYVPKRPLEENDSYADADTELADIDLVTVEATIDTAELSSRFEQSFGTAKNITWAKPVFAGVELQRQEILKSGAWANWQTVPRMKIDELRSRFNIPQKMDGLDKSIEILMLQFDHPDVRSQLLQPRTYDFAYPSYSWLPPSLAAKRQDKMDKLKIEEQKKKREDARKAEEEKAKSRLASRSSSASSTGRLPTQSIGTQNSQMRTQPPRSRETSTIQADTTANPAAVKPEAFTEEQEFAKIKITGQTDLFTVKEPVLFWAHDDTAEPGKTYKYRIRIGVFDPIAGTNSFKDTDKAYKNDVILWSNYSQATEQVTVPARWYFFPQTYRDSDKMVNARVCRYLLAKWYSKDFRVKPGEIIGMESENDMNADEPNNFANGTVLVDVVPIVEVDKNYANALFSSDFGTIEHIAVKQQYWPSDLKAKFEEIARLQKEPSPAFATRSSERVHITE